MKNEQIVYKLFIFCQIYFAQLEKMLNKNWLAIAFSMYKIYLLIQICQK